MAATIAPPDVGQTAPDFPALDSSGKIRTLSDLCIERPLVLVFYRGHW